MCPHCNQLGQKCVLNFSDLLIFRVYFFFLKQVPILLRVSCFLISFLTPFTNLMVTFSVRSLTPPTPWYQAASQALKRRFQVLYTHSYLPHEWLSENTAYSTSKNLALQLPFSQNLVTDSLQFSYLPQHLFSDTANLQEPSAACPKVPSALLLTTAMYSF